MTSNTSCICQPESNPDAQHTGRNLVVCIDGTSNQFGKKNTNVVELYSQLIKDENQLTYYNSGVGTYPEPSRKSISHWLGVIDSMVDLAVAWNFQRIVLGAYQWLSENHRPGDKIFLFGFSRGAYQVRTIAGMIDKVGLIHKGNNEQIPFAYGLYVKGDTKGAPSSQSLAGRFKETFSKEDVRVHFIGVWDTVSSIGVIRGKSLPGTLAPNLPTCFFRHALALDERRIKFLPEYANGGEMGVSARVKEVWFPGTHSDIGGGNRPNENLDLRHPSLLWMKDEALSEGLKVRRKHVDWRWDQLSEVQESMKFPWNLFEYVPLRRLSYTDEKDLTWRPHRRNGRKIVPGQKIHASVAFCPKDSRYQPWAILPKDKKWENLVSCGDKTDMRWAREWKDLLEMDFFDIFAADKLISSFQVTETHLHRLKVLSWSDEGREQLRGTMKAADTLIGAMEGQTLEVQCTVANAIVEFATKDEIIQIFQKSAGWEGGMTFQKKFLADGNATERKLKAIGAMAVNNDLRHKLVEFDVPESLLSRLGEKGVDWEITQSALDALTEFAKHSTLRSRTISETSFSQAVKATVEDKERAIRWSAFEAITEFAKHTDSRDKIMEFTVPYAIAIGVRDESSNVRRSAFNAITEISKHELSRAKLCSPEISLGLRDGIQDFAEIVRCSALNAVAELAKHADSRPLLMQGDLISGISACFEHPSAEVCVAAHHAAEQLEKDQSFRQSWAAISEGEPEDDESFHNCDAA